jgi:hypothetical protein
MCFERGFVVERQMSNTGLLKGMTFEIGKMNEAAEHGLGRG